MYVKLFLICHVRYNELKQRAEARNIKFQIFEKAGDKTRLHL